MTRINGGLALSYIKHLFSTWKIIIYMYRQLDGMVYQKIVAAFREMHVSPVKHSFGKCDRKVWQTDRQTDGWTDRQTDGRRTKWSLCIAMLRRRHKNSGVSYGLRLCSLIAYYFYVVMRGSYLKKSKRLDLTDKFNDASRYLDDLFTIDSPEFDQHLLDIY